MKTSNDLLKILNKIDGRTYSAYKEIKGKYLFDTFLLSIDHIQGDPFASPSKITIKVSNQTAGFPKELYVNDSRKRSLQDTLLRTFGIWTEKLSFKAKGSGKSGLLAVSRCGQEILERSSCEIHKLNGDIILRMEAGMPANGRRIHSKEAVKLLFECIPVCIEKALFYKVYDHEVLKKKAELADDQAYLRNMLKEKGLCAFIADGAILPRESGISQKPMKNAVPFRSPDSFAVYIDLPYGGRIRGMGIQYGITLIAGGGYHGKSTFLQALERGVYDHIMGDGREYVMTDDTAMKIRAEDGRCVRAVDISLFIQDLPNGRDTECFYTEDASGSTSQAANVVEALEADSRLLLMDEDTSAANFMIRDELMQMVVQRNEEPIIPYIDRIQQLYQRKGVSSIIVAGSSGAYFQKADRIIQMKQYLPIDITDFAKEAAKSFPVKSVEIPEWKEPHIDRKPLGIKRKRDDRFKLKTLDTESIQFNREKIDLRYVEQLVDPEQLTLLGYMLDYAEKNLMDGQHSLSEIVNEFVLEFEKKGLQIFFEKGYPIAGLCVPRKQEMYACLNRYRKLQL